MKNLFDFLEECIKYKEAKIANILWVDTYDNKPQKDNIKYKIYIDQETLVVTIRIYHTFS